MKTWMRWGAAALIVAAGVAVLLTFPAHDGGARSVHLSANDDGRNVHIHPGDEIVVTLASNASTGFRWVLAAQPDPRVLELAGSSYVAPSTSLLGAPGQEVWRFRATGQGSTTLELSYQRASGETAGEPFGVSVDVANG